MGAGQPQGSLHTTFMPHAHSFPCSLSHLQGTTSPCSPQSPQLNASPAKPLYPSHHGVFLPRIPVGMASTSLHFALCCVQLSSRGLVSQGGWETRQAEPRLLCVCTLSQCVPDPELGRRVCQVTSGMSGSLRPQGL